MRYLITRRSLQLLRFRPPSMCVHLSAYLLPPIADDVTQPLAFAADRIGSASTLPCACDILAARWTDLERGYVDRACASRVYFPSRRR